MTRYKILILLSLLLFLCMFSGSQACQSERHLYRYLIPDGYVGWVKVYYNVKTAPALPIEDGYQLFKFPPSGRLETSSAIKYGSFKAEYFYYDGENRRPLKLGEMIWGAYNGKTDSGEIYEGFFVGSHDEFLKYCCGSEKLERKPGDVKRKIE